MCGGEEEMQVMDEHDTVRERAVAKERRPGAGEKQRVVNRSCFIAAEMGACLHVEKAHHRGRDVPCADSDETDRGRS